jgi:transcription initiation factor TFIID subunit TAF12
MALPNGAGGYQLGAGNRAETVMGYAAAPQTATSTATLTAAQVTGGMLVANPSTSAATYTLPTAALIDAAVPNAVVGSTFDLNVVNTGTSSGAVTLATATGLTDGGNAFVAVAVTSSALFRFRKTADAAWTVYKVA